MPSLFDFGTCSSNLSSKTHLTHGTLPAYVDPAQPPTKKSPWRQIREVPFVHSVNLVMPEEMYRLVWERIDEEAKKVRYVKVVMGLEEVLEGDFFTEFVKRGNCLMLSEGCSGVDNIFSLRDVGVLRLNLDQQSYERAGLQGQPIRGGGKKHVKARYLVEIDLRQPSMLHGKKGFERIIWAAKNVLNKSLVWLFADLTKSKEAPVSPSPLNKHHPNNVEESPHMHTCKGIIVPAMLYTLTAADRRKVTSEDEEEFYELREWLDAIALGSINGREGGEYNVEDSQIPVGDATTLRFLTMEGLIDHHWITRLLINVITLSRSTKSPWWVAFTATAHCTEAVDQADGYTIILTSPRDLDQGTEADPENMDVLSPSKASQIWQNKGLEHFTIFEMIDSNNSTT